MPLIIIIESIGIKPNDSINDYKYFFKLLITRYCLYFTNFVSRRGISTWDCVCPTHVPKKT